MAPYDLELREADPALIGGAAGAAAVLAAFGRLFVRMRREEAGRLIKLLRREAPAEPAEALREVTRGELDREKKFEEGVRKRLQRDLPAAFAITDPLERRHALDQIIDREKRYLEAREEAMATRALNAVSRFSLKRVSPEGAYWTLSPDVKRHTLDCIMLAHKFWPWEVLDELHPPMHPGCACDLISKREAVAQGLMHEDQVPDKKDALRRARELYQWAKSVEHAAEPGEIVAYLDSLEEAEWNPNLHPRDRRGHFRDVPGRPAITRALRDLLPGLPSTPASRRAAGRGGWRWAGGHRVFVPHHRHFERTIGGHTYTSPPDSHLLYRDDRLTSDETERLKTGVLNIVGKANPVVLDAIKQRLPQGESRVKARLPGKTPLFDKEPMSWEEFAHDTQGLMEALGRRFTAPVLIGDIVNDPKRYDHSGFEDWEGNLYFGHDVLPSVEAEAERLRRGNAPTDRDLELTYGTFRIQAHEASHGVNPSDENDYATPGGYTLEEGLTEAAAHIIARENLERVGRWDVIDWANAHPGSPHVEGTYLAARTAINKVFDAAHVPHDDRNQAVLHLKFETPPPDRVNELVRLSEQYNALTRQEVLDLLSQGVEATPQTKASLATHADPGPSFPGGVKVIYGEDGVHKVIGPFGSWDQVADEVVRLHGEGTTDVRMEAGLRGGRKLNAREQAHVVKLATERLTGHSDPGAWERVSDKERPTKLYHGTAAKNEAGILRRGLTVHKSRKRVKERDTQSLLFLTSDVAQAEWWARGGPMYEVDLPKDAPLYRDSAFPDAYFTTENVSPDRLRRVQHQELIDAARARREGHSDPGVVDVGADVNRAADLLAQGKRVQLDQPREVTVLLDKLAERVAEAKRLGKDAPVYDLCKVTVKGTNLFCAESKGIPRIKMPQLGGFPAKGSRGDLEAKKEPNGYVDLTAQFHDYLKEQGVKVTDTTEKAEYLRPTQMELNGAKVASILHRVDAGDPPLGWEDRLPVSRDNYILDGHHRWAAQIGEDAEDGKLGNVEVPITRIDMPITELLDAAHKYADDWGLPELDVGGHADPGVTQGAVRPEWRTAVEATRTQDTADRAAKAGMTVKEYQDAVAKHTTEMLRGAHIGIRVQRDQLDGILDHGGLHRTQSPDFVGKRAEYERKVFAETAQHGTVYGYVMGDKAPYYSPTISTYGPINLVLKDDVKRHATFTAGDSLVGIANGTMVPAPFDTPDLYAWPPKSPPVLERLDPTADPLAVRSLDPPAMEDETTLPYAEAQIHRDVTLADIDHVEVGDLGWLTDEQQAKLKGLGVPVTVLPTRT